MGKQITLDYDDLVGAFYMSALETDPENGCTIQEAKKFVQCLFDYVEKWQESGRTLESFEDAN